MRLGFGRGGARRAGAALAFLLLSAPVYAGADGDLAELSLEDLMQVEVTSVSKKAERLSDAPAAVTILSGEDLRRSGHTHLAEALRLVPGVNVARIDASKWAITARGFNGEFANKLLVMIDGRSVYTPLFSGVYWDVQDLPLEDVERIEVVRGPGGALWGANAVNGVINVITRQADDTEGLLVSAGGGTHELLGTLRFGGSLAGGDAHYRVFARAHDRADFDAAGAGDARDAWDTQRGGFRVDWRPTDRDTLTVQGDLYGGDGEQPAGLSGSDEFDVRGGNLLGRWTRSFSETARTRVQLSYDRTERDSLVDEERDTFDLELQHDFAPASWAGLSWGFGYRMTHDDIGNGAAVGFTPDERTDHLGSAFAQLRLDVIEDRLALFLGSKLELNEYSGLEVQPSARVRLTPAESHTLWAAVSRAVRTPARSDQDVVISAFPGFQLVGDPDFDAAELLAWELGYRAALRSDLTLDASAFYFDYDDVQALELAGVGPLGLIAAFANGLDANAYGIELEGAWQPASFLRLFAAYGFLDLDSELRDGALAAISDDDESPRHQWQLRAQLDLPRDVELDGALYYVDDVSGQADGQGRPVRSYYRADLRLGFHPREDLSLELVGRNLLDGGHAEFGSVFGTPSEVPRTAFARITWTH